MTDQTPEARLAAALATLGPTLPDNAYIAEHLAADPTLAADLALAEKWQTVAHVLAESIAYHRYRTRHDAASCMPCKALAIYDKAAKEASE